MNKFLINFVITFISIYSLFFAFGLENAHYGGSRSAYFKDLKNIDLKYTEKNIQYFANQKWSRNSWYKLNSFISVQNNISKNCKIEYAANLTSNTFYYVLLNYKKIQVIPFFYKEHGQAYLKYFDPNLINELQNQINKNNVLIVSFENNDKILNLENYAIPIKLNLNKYTEKQKKFLYIYYPNQCNVT